MSGFLKDVAKIKKIVTYIIFIFIATSVYVLAKGNKSADDQHNVAVEADSPIVIEQDTVDVTLFENSRLQKGLDHIIEDHPLWNTLVKQKRMAVAVLDLSQESAPKYARVNGSYMMYAASLPKIAVLLSAEDALEHKEIKPTPALEKDMRLMISKSNNQATTRIIDKLGFKKIEEVLTDDAYNFYNAERGGGLWVGKRYAAGGKTNRDPLKNLSHAASVNQVAKFYYLLYERKLISKERSEHMLAMLEDPELYHKFVHTLKKISPDAKLYRKSGTWKTWHADSVLVVSEDKKYVLVALIEDPKGEQIIRDLVEPLSNLISKTPKDNP